MLDILSVKALSASSTRSITKLETSVAAATRVLTPVATWASKLATDASSFASADATRLVAKAVAWA